MSWSGFQLRNKFSLLKTFYKNGESTTPSAKTPNHFWKKRSNVRVYWTQTNTKFETTGSVLTVKSHGPKRSSRSEEQLVLCKTVSL